MRRDLGVSELFLFGVFSAALLVSGTLAPVMGRLIDRRGGRFVLALGSVLGAAACALLAVAPDAVTMSAGWLVAGAAMAACLYDPAFATLAQHAASRYRRAVTALTLFGGFASTVFWPLSLLLLEAWGWRATWAIYAGLHLAICLAIHLAFVPAFRRVDKARHEAEEVSPAMRDPRLGWLTLSVAAATFVFGVMAVHLVSLLTAAGLTAAQAVSVSMLVGPMQVAGRVVEFTVSRRVRSVSVGIVVFVLMLLALVALVNVQGFGVMAIAFVVAYGCGNGLFTIVRGTAPVELFGARGLGALLGHLSRAGLYARAVAPGAFSGFLAMGLTQGAAIGALAVVSVAGLGGFLVATRPRASVD
jgi:predicted MFS family arabinose efflux permease